MSCHRYSWRGAYQKRASRRKAEGREQKIHGFADVERACGRFLRERGINYRNLAGLITDDGNP